MPATLDTLHLPYGARSQLTDRWNEATKVGVKIAVELAAGCDVQAYVWRWTVRRLKPGLYRGLVLVIYQPQGPTEFRLFDSSAIEVTYWLRSQGVPALKLGRALK